MCCQSVGEGQIHDQRAHAKKHQAGNQIAGGNCNFFAKERINEGLAHERQFLFEVNFIQKERNDE